MLKKTEEQVKKVVQKVVLESEIVKLKQQTEQQLNQAKQQLLFWNAKVKQFTGSLITYNDILAKSQEVKNLKLKGK